MPRIARQTRPQLVCVLADNSGSMAGEKAQAATRGPEASAVFKAFDPVQNGLR
jgi:hypothetical protein